MTLNENQTFRAAQYVRMSTEHQQYSTLNQADKIREYADKRGIHPERRTEPRLREELPSGEAS